MKNDVELPAIHDWHLKGVLAELGLLQALESGDMHCARCAVPLTLANVGGILVGPKHTYQLVCTGLACLSQPPERPQR